MGPPNQLIEWSLRDIRVTPLPTGMKRPVVRYAHDRDEETGLLRWGADETMRL